MFACCTSFAYCKIEQIRSYYVWCTMKVSRFASTYCVVIIIIIVIMHCCCHLVMCIGKVHLRDAMVGRDTGDVQVALSPKKQCQKYGCMCKGSSIDCVNIEPNMLNKRVFELAHDARSISFTNCSQRELDLHVFSNFTSLRDISVRNCALQKLRPVFRNSLQNLHVLDLSYNYLSDWDELLCKIINELPSLQKVDVSNNHFTDLSHTGQCVVRKLQYLNLSYNQISKLYTVPNTVILDLSSNQLTQVVGEWPSSLSNLNLSNNPSLELYPSLSLLHNLTHLNMDSCELASFPLSVASNLRRLSLQNNKLLFIDFNSLKLPSLQELDLGNSPQLHSIVGMLPTKVKDFRLTNTAMKYLPEEFFIKVRNFRFIELMPNNWSCNKCLLKWTKTLPPSLRPQLICANNINYNCSLGILKNVEGSAKFIIRVPYAETAILPCDAYGYRPLSINWWLVRPEILIGGYDVERRIVSMNWTCDSTYEIITGGSLLIRNARKEVVERYRCVAANREGNASQIVHFRLDYSNWYHLAMSESVFWGSIMAAVITSGVTFILNLLWIICQKIGLWWIKRIERISRAREMVSAMERYRQRQMAALSDAYHKKLEQVRENYRQQVEQLRASYSLQSERFHDYRVAQMENMNQHLENIRENYNQQMCKLRDYGSRRVEQLWEGYERQVNRLRMFSLQQRLSLMRKYKVKQHYLNKLLEKASDSSSPTFVKPCPETILTEPGRELDIEMHRHAGSFYSLPEYVLHEDDLLGTVQSELFQEFRDIYRHNPLTGAVGGDSDGVGDTPCCSKQDRRRSSITVELTGYRRRALSDAERQSSKGTSLNLGNDESEPLSSDHTSFK